MTALVTGSGGSVSESRVLTVIILMEKEGSPSCQPREISAFLTLQTFMFWVPGACWFLWGLDGPSPHSSSPTWDVTPFLQQVPKTTLPHYLAFALSFKYVLCLSARVTLIW